jgi:hypothetical protein
VLVIVAGRREYRSASSAVKPSPRDTVVPHCDVA